MTDNPRGLDVVAWVNRGSKRAHIRWRDEDAMKHGQSLVLAADYTALLDELAELRESLASSREVNASLVRRRCQMDDELAELRANAWKTMESAPKDLRVLVYKDGKQYAAQWAQNPSTGQIAWCIGDLGDGDRALLESPTRWRPLPENPE